MENPFLSWLIVLKIIYAYFIKFVNYRENKNLSKKAKSRFVTSEWFVIIG